MKKIFLLTLPAFILFAGCSKEAVVVEENNNANNYSLSASLEANGLTKATNTGIGKLLWATGDAIDVWDGTRFSELSISSGVGSQAATFSGSIVESGSPSIALYPAIAKEMDGGTVTMTLPTTYTYSNHGVEMPMAGKISAGTVAFTHLGAVLKFDMNDIPSDATQFVFTAVGKKVSGDFTYDSTSDWPYISTSDSASENTVTITFPAGSMTSASFFIPIPTGTYSGGFSIAVKNAGGTTLFTKSRSSSFTANRAAIAIQSAVDCKSDVNDNYWSGSFNVQNWRLNWSQANQEDATKNYDWSQVPAGSELVLTVELNDTYLDSEDNVQPNTYSLWSLAFNDVNYSGTLGIPDYSFTSGQTEARITLSQASIDALVANGGLVIGGYCVTIKSINVFKHNRTRVELKNTLWEGSKVCADWTALADNMSYGAYNWYAVKPGSILRVTVADKVPEKYWQIHLRHADSWGAVPDPFDVDLKAGQNTVDIPLTLDNLNDFIANDGLLLVGTNLTITKVELVVNSFETETTLWTGNWVASSDWSTAMADFSWGGFNWDTISAGQVLRFYLTPSASCQLALTRGSDWGALTDNLTIPISTSWSFIDVRLTADNISDLRNYNGLIIGGQNYTLTKITIPQ